MASGARRKLIDAFPALQSYLHPDIVRAVVEDTAQHREDWSRALLARGIDPEIYLWDGSPCVFPGVRRYAGSREVAAYSLAHLADHRQHRNRASDEFERTSPSTPLRPLFGLYTSAANTVYVPCNLIRPTDFAGALRNLLIRRSQSLYGSFCRLLPSEFSISAASSAQWELDRFTWAEPVGTPEHIPKFLAFRRAEVARIISPLPATAPASG